MEQPTHLWVLWVRAGSSELVASTPFWGGSTPFRGGKTPSV
jgi:hypothetical protein